jgi:hypothetical protein
MVFHLPHMTSDALEDATIVLSCYDADYLTHTLIGSFALEVAELYSRPGHGLHRAWVGLIKASATDAGSLCGTLRVSVEVLGPGDEVLVPDPGYTTFSMSPRSSRRRKAG